MHSLRTKISFLTIGIIVFALAVVTLLSVVFIRNTEHQNSEQQLLLMCETGERNLDYYFTSVEKSVKNIAAHTEKDLDGLDDEKLAAHIERVRPYFERIVGKTNGVLTYYYRIDPAVSATVPGFWYTNLDGKDFTEHPVTDISLYDTEDTSQLVWFTVPKKTGSPIWLSPYITDNLDVRVLSFNYPVTYRGRFIGVIGIEIDHTTMAEQVESIRLYNNGYAFLTDKDGSLIFHPRIDVASLPEDSTPAMPDGMLSDSTFTGYTYEGVQKKAAWLRLDNGMRLYVSVPVDETESVWRQTIRTIIFGYAGVLIVSVILSYFFAIRITRPLKDLTEAAKKADAGDYGFSLNYTGKDEVGALTKTFTNMAGHMKEHISDLNRRAYVDALTSVRNKGAYASYIEDMQGQMDADPGAIEYAIGVFDCDDLKSVNDNYGHDKGDAYLKAASRLICKVFQHSPVFRIGGDEFSVVLRNDDYRNREELVDTFEKACAVVNDASQNIWEQVHVSIGLAVYDRLSDKSVIDTVRRADKMMYANKRQHKNTGG